MPQAVTCPACKRQYANKPELAGKRAKCKCGGRIKFPAQVLREADLLEAAPQAVASAASPVASAGLNPAAAYVNTPAPRVVAPPPLPGTIPSDGETMPQFPAAAEEEVLTAMDVADDDSVSIQRDRKFSPVRLSAGRISILLAVLLYLGGMGIGIAGMSAMGNARHQPGELAASILPFGLGGPIGLIYAAIIFILATVYLICGIIIRAGGYVSSIVALVLAGLHGLFLLELVREDVVVAYLRSEQVGLVALTGVGFHMLVAVVVLFLVYHLTRVLTEPQHATTMRAVRGGL